MKLTTTGQIANETAKRIYKSQRAIVILLAKSGIILAKNIDIEWAIRVSAKLTKAGLKVPVKIIKMMK